MSAPTADRPALEAPSFLSDTLAGLGREHKSIPGKYLWDEAGSACFAAISRSPEYYLTAPEAALLRRCVAEVAKAIGPGACIVEFGSGASEKIQMLLDGLPSPRRYIAVDISQEILEEATARIRAECPNIDVLHVCADYSEALPQLSVTRTGTVLGFLPGTTIGNLEPDAAIQLLARIRDALAPASFLIGHDPTTDARRLAEAYGSDLMAVFHKNILVRLQRELGAELTIEDFDHAARFVADLGKVEAHLVANRRTEIRIGRHSFSLAPGESILTDQSRKYRPEQFRELLHAAGRKAERHWLEPDGLYSLFLADAAT